MIVSMLRGFVLLVLLAVTLATGVFVGQQYPAPGLLPPVVPGRTPASCSAMP